MHYLLGKGNNYQLLLLRRFNVLTLFGQTQGAVNISFHQLP